MSSDSEELVCWLSIRDSMFGHNFKKREEVFPELLRRAERCKHEDSQWFFETCKQCKTWAEAKQVFQLGSDAKSSFFAAMLFGNSIRPFAESGLAFAQALVAHEAFEDEERFEWAHKSALQGEREGLFSLGRCYEIGCGCPKDVDEAHRCYLKAAALGCAKSCKFLALGFSRSDPMHWHWLIKAAEFGDTQSYLETFHFAVGAFRMGKESSSGAVVFEIGHGLKRHINVEQRTLFNNSESFSVYSKPALDAIGFYDNQVRACRLAIDTWILIGIRLNVVKDVRRLIAKLIWVSRQEAKYT